MEYEKATPDMVDLVAKIGKAHHQRLDGLRIAVIQQDKASLKGGKRTLASAMKPTAKMMPLLRHGDTAFVICIARDQWELASQKKREAIVDHELCHCGIGSSGPTLLPHDYEEFAQVVKRHGFWRGDPAEVQLAQAILPLTERQPVKVDTIADRLPAGEDQPDEKDIAAALKVIKDTRRASTSSVQRRLRMGYTRTARIFDILEERGIVGPPNGAEPREILIAL